MCDPKENSLTIRATRSRQQISHLNYRFGRTVGAQLVLRADDLINRAARKSARGPPSGTVMCITVGTAAARRDRMMARVEGHLAHPGADGAHSVENRPFDEHLERSPQNLKQIREIH